MDGMGNNVVRYSIIFSWNFIHGVGGKERIISMLFLPQKVPFGDCKLLGYQKRRGVIVILKE